MRKKSVATLQKDFHWILYNVFIVILDKSFRKVHVATLLVAVYCNIPRLFFFSINGVSFSSLLYFCVYIFSLIFIHSRPFLQLTEGIELFIHLSLYNLFCFQN